MKANTHWPTDKIERWPLQRIKPYPKNPRSHPDKQIALLADLFAKYGPDQPIVVDDKGVVLKGHGRLLAAQHAGMAEFPVIRRTGLTAAQKTAIRISDNQVQLLSGWDGGLLQVEVEALKMADFDLTELGFDADVLFGLLNRKTGLTDPEDAPEPVADPYVKSGDLWKLGNHRLICGDCTKAEVVERLLDGAKPHLMVTDPPYGVDYDPNWRNNATRVDGSAIGAAALGKVQNDHIADWTEAWKLFGGDVGYIWHAGRRAAETAVSLTSCGFFLRAQIIWRKNRTIIGRGDYHYNHEPCWYVVRNKKTGHWGGRRDQGTVWDIAHDPNNTGHGTQKPTECMKRPIENNSKAGDAVYEPFSGSGTTIIAAEMTARKCYAIEIDPAYCQVAIERWQGFTGQKAQKL